MGQNDREIQHYLQAGLVALLPGYGEGEGGTQVYTLQEANGDSRSLPWLVEVLARFYRLDLAAVRRHTGRLLEVSHHIPLPLAEGLVLLPVKVRQAAALGEHTNGYVSLLQVMGVEAVNGEKGPRANGPNQTIYAAGEPELIRSRIICRGALVIYCLNTAATVKTKLRQGEAAHQELLQRQRITAGPAAPFSGLKGERLRELLPSCDCLLRNFFLVMLESAFGLKPEQQREQAQPTAPPAASAGTGKK